MFKVVAPLTKPTAKVAAGTAGNFGSIPKTIMEPWKSSRFSGFSGPILNGYPFLLWNRERKSPRTSSASSKLAITSDGLGSVKKKAGRTSETPWIEIRIQGRKKKIQHGCNKKTYPRKGIFMAFLMLALAERWCHSWTLLWLSSKCRFRLKSGSTMRG